MRRKGQEPVRTQELAPQSGALVPFYGAPGITPGIQAYRRGDIILYTIRGEPQKVLELMGQLDRQGVREVIALISHQAAESAPAQDGKAPEQQ